MSQGEPAFQITKEPYLSSQALKFVTDRQPNAYEVVGLNAEFKGKVMLRVKHQRLGYDFYLDLTTQDWKHIGQPMPGDIISIKVEITGRG